MQTLKVRLSFFQKNIRYNKLLLSLLKYYDRKKYNEEKRKRAQLRLKFFSERFTVAPRVHGRPTTFKHSGNAGDVIYALPALRELAGGSGADLKLQVGAPLPTPFHPTGGAMLNAETVEKLMPLLRAQSYIRSVDVFSGGVVDFDLDILRESPIPPDRMCISRWYFCLFAVTADLSQPWLKAAPDTPRAGRIVVARSSRYRNLVIDYTVLNRYEAPLFVGLESEYMDFKRWVPRAEWAPVRDFLELAEIIAGARLFIGNQSFPFAIAEGLKVPRILEVDPATPNVVPSGANAHEVLFQPQFARILEQVIA